MVIEILVLCYMAVMSRWGSWLHQYELLLRGYVPKKAKIITIYFPENKHSCKTKVISDLLSDDKGTNNPLNI